MSKRRLYLMRHAKSSWKEAGIADHDRPLAGRGRRASKAMGQWMREHRVKPELVLCSSAARARQTFERVEPLGAREVHIERELYAADAATLLARLRDVPEPVTSVMLIGHNPGIEDLARVLAHLNTEKFPTGALAILTFDRPWGALEKDGAEVLDFIKPRELADES